jgi:hypothetical protein
VKRVAIAGAALALSGVGAFALAPSAQADPLVCVVVSLNVQGMPVGQAICLPPDGSVPGGLPIPGGLPTIPGLPPLPI